MQFALEIGNQEKTRIEFYRNPWGGTMRITANGQTVTAKSSRDLSIHFNFEYVKRYEVTVGKQEKHQFAIEHERPRLLGGLRPHTYRVYVDEQLVEEHHGF